MGYLEDLLVFLWAVINSWAGYATGGIVVALLSLWSTLKQIPISRRVGIVVALVFLFFAVFHAWREQYLKTKRALTMELTDVGPTDKIPGYDAIPVIVWAVIRNHGAPTIADTWDLKVTTADHRTAKKGDVAIILMNKPFIFDGKYKLDPSMALYQQTKNPIPSGAKPEGLLAFMVSGFTKEELAAKGTTYVLTCKDISGNQVEASATTTGAPTKGFPLRLGVPVEEIQQPKQ